MQTSKKKKNDNPSGFAFINVAHPDQIRQKATQRAIRSGAMAAIGRSRRKRPVQPITFDLDLPAVIADDCVAELEGWKSGPPVAVDQPMDLAKSQCIPYSLLHLGAFPVEPDTRDRELINFGTSVPRPFTSTLADN